MKNVLVLVDNNCLNDTRVKKSSESLAKNGLNVTVLCHSSTSKKTYSKLNGVTYIGLVVHKRLNFIQRKLRRVFGAGKTYKDWYKANFLNEALRLEPDAVHCHDLQTLGTGVAIKKRKGSILIYDSHELEMHRNASYTKNEQIGRQSYERKNIRYCDEVITVSNSIAKHIRADYKLVKDVHVIMNTPDLRKSVNANSDIKADLELESSKSLAIYVGLVTFNRGLENLVSSLVHTDGVHLAMIGPQRAHIRRSLEHLAIKLNISDRVHFVAPREHSELLSYIKTADLSVIPIVNSCLSHDYCLPNKLFESLFAGLPVLVNNLKELSEFVQKNKCGLVITEETPESIGIAIQKAISEKITVPDTAALNAYTWEEQEKKLAKIYSSLGDFAEQRKEIKS